ncbi:shikimate dehydrogenase family protein [Sphingobacterium sp. CZ-2]|uniref:shikimate dehydrogenase family protein n=1 Tax=Sphingobacterium sp. CZ-2 TaxID=2557994 RepID=UPI00106F8D67|nr:shikimate dehydrogenase [Sphingobacterium sp. CZ-2]QBR13691.1 shikimate dehydrogenase [Sphingobacterium sp. CZ-2]
MKYLGLIGYPLGHSFSKKYYLDKFDKENIQGIDYDLYPISDIEKFPELYTSNPDFYGVNVTIPYKQDVIPYLDELSEEAKVIGAVNCIQIKRQENGRPYLKGFNTDAYGFEQSLLPFLKLEHKKALILGNGGATKAVKYVLDKLRIPYQVVSRTKDAENISYADLTDSIIAQHQIIINCSPVGTYPNIDQCPDIPFEGIGPGHLLYDLIYNPEETLFLQKGKARGAAIKNGFEMLVLQAEKNWEVWNQ